MMMGCRWTIAVGEVKIRIIVPEEFVGASQQELTARQGLITGMEAQEHSVVIYASLPSEKYDGLVEAIVANTQGPAGWTWLRADS